ncbi:NADP-dependent oxidoreductase [Paenibacillus daejeonensis]|uniref:NADP-dependent oxidoreductase n=1 Tax=Paenibacillus daejeonensis TaxID=135193 RepID=UPI000361C94B|nr:NADP-dependent oxidoreductase [Paenibacillus daejeonensis]
MSASINRTIVLASRPQGMPTEDQFRIQEEPIPAPAEEEVVVRSLYISVDPYMRNMMNNTSSSPIDQVIRGGAVGQVISSRSGKLREGDIVSGMWGWQEYAAVKADDLQRIDPDQAPISTALGVLGMPGLTAYFGLFDIGKPEPGETVVVSGAAGAVGTIVGQIAKLKGCRVVGIAGSEEKLNYLKDDLGFDAVVNYKSDAFDSQLKEACPGGVDIYFDNVGGPVSDAVIGLINQKARIPLCGQISTYNLDKVDVGPRIQPQLLMKRAMIKGFLVYEYEEQYPEAIVQLARWVQGEKIQYTETVLDGFERLPEAFLGLFEGSNTGKLLVKVAEVE